MRSGRTLTQLELTICSYALCFRRHLQAVAFNSAMGDAALVPGAAVSSRDRFLGFFEFDVL